MKIKYKEFITNLSYTLTSNIVSMIISTLIIMIIPKLIGVSEYGYWQLYIFYTGYLGFFNIGWVEGIYLRYGGAEYHKLDKGLFASQFWSFFLYIFLAGSVITAFSFFYVSDGNKQYIIQMVAICMVLSVPRGFLLFVLESTNKLKEYSKLTIFERVIYCAIIIPMISMGIRDFKYLVAADLVGKTLALLLTLYTCKALIFNKLISLKDNFKEILNNISVGIKLMFANIVSMLIVGVVRFGIERSWDLKTFGKVSLTISIANLMMLFINAIGIILFPILRRTDAKKLPGIYTTMRDFLMVILFGVLIIYYPLKLVMSAWLPQYAESLKYMALLFPMCVYEGKMALLVNTYLKTMRKEMTMLKVNVVSLGLCVLITLVTTLLLKNLDLAIASIVMILAFRCTLAEMFLSKVLEISLHKDIIMELSMTVAFVLTGWFIHSWLSVLLYSIAYLLYLFLKRKDITSTARKLKLLMN